MSEAHRILKVELANSTLLANGLGSCAACNFFEVSDTPIDTNIIIVGTCTIPDSYEECSISIGSVAGRPKSNRLVTVAVEYYDGVPLSCPDVPILKAALLKDTNALSFSIPSEVVGTANIAEAVA